MHASEIVTADVRKPHRLGPCVGSGTGALASYAKVLLHCKDIHVRRPPCTNGKSGRQPDRQLRKWTSCRRRCRRHANRAAVAVSETRQASLHGASVALQHLQRPKAGLDVAKLYMWSAGWQDAL
ncbi:hypothetical protein MTO96_000285 [Rhipicephalus appendiculatus]